MDGGVEEALPAQRKSFRNFQSRFLAEFQGQDGVGGYTQSADQVGDLSGDFGGLSGTGVDWDGE